MSLPRTPSLGGQYGHLSPELSLDLKVDLEAPTIEGARMYCHALSKHNGEFSLLMACRCRLLNDRLERLCRMQHLDPEHPGRKEDCLGVLIALIGGDG
eukprot:SM000136S00193  [mRNA]  locus=s136:368847:369913:+ [translate_table: standard]